MKHWMATVTLTTIASATVMAPQAQAQALKGVSLSTSFSESPSKADRVGAVWYRSLLPGSSLPVPEDDRFVPTIRGRDVDDATFRAIRLGRYSALLGFDESDWPTGSDKSDVRAALEYWPKLVATGKRLGSPAISDDFGFLDDFMAGARRQGLRVDFIAHHSYSSVSDPEAAAASVAALVDWVHDRYGLPVWVTELGVQPDASLEGPLLTERFVRAIVPLLQDRDFVERFAWADTGEDGLLDNKGGLTRLGRVYKCPPCEQAQRF